MNGLGNRKKEKTDGREYRKNLTSSITKFCLPNEADEHEG